MSESVASDTFPATETVRAKAASLPILLLVAALTPTIAAFDYSGVSVALASISRDLHAEPARGQWVISAAQLIMGSFLILGGRLADVFGQRRCVLTALGLWMAGAVITAVSSDITMLIVGRGVSGLGLAGLLPGLGSLYFRLAQPGEPLRRVIAAHGVSLTVGSALGMLVAGWLISHAGWRAMLEVFVAYAGIVGCLIWFLVPPTPTLTQTRSLDLPGAALVTFSCGALIFVATLARTHGLLGAETLGCLVASCAGFAALVVVERRAADPAIPLALFRLPNVGASLVAAIFGYAAATAPFVALTLQLQYVGQYSAERVGTLFLFKAAAIVLGGFVAPTVYGQLGPRIGFAIGYLFLGVSSAAFFFLSSLISAPLVVVGLVAYGLGSVTTMVGVLTEVPRPAAPEFKASLPPWSWR